MVEVCFDPKLIAREELERRGRAGCVTEAFLPSSEIRSVEDQKYYLRQTALRFVPMTPAQAARVNASATGDPLRWLSPAQRAAAAYLSAAPETAWQDLVGVPLSEAWNRLRQQAAARAAAEPADAELTAD